MAQAMERLLATPKTIPVFPASNDMINLVVNGDRLREIATHRQENIRGEKPAFRGPAQKGGEPLQNQFGE